MRRRRDDKAAYSLTTSQPYDLILKVKFLLMDEETGKVMYGAMANLIEKLLSGWMLTQVNDKKVEWENPAIQPILDEIKKGMKEV